MILVIFHLSLDLPRSRLFSSLIDTILIVLSMSWSVKFDTGNNSVLRSKLKTVLNLKDFLF